MIVEFNPTIFESQDRSVLKSLAEFLITLTKKDHLLVIKGLENIFYKDYTFTFGESVMSKEYFSKSNLRNLESYFNGFRYKQAYITALHKKHLSRIVIGLEDGEIHPVLGLKILTERSIVLVENGINDWTFLDSLSKKYSNHKIRGSIYELVKKAIKKDYLESIHCGGTGEIKKITEKWIHGRYKDIHKWKLLAVFDSDKTDKDSDTPNRHLLKYFKKLDYIQDPIKPEYYLCEENDLMPWHILYKRKLENYVPISVIIKHATQMTEQNKTDLEKKSFDELDFIEYGLGNINMNESAIKENFPKMFTFDFSYRDLENRCSHHLAKYTLPDGSMEEISEIEIILLKIAKII